MAESKTSENRLKAVERQRRALELRAEGKTFVEIARELGYRGPSGAFNAVQVALRKTLQEPADALRQLECERLDRLLEAIWKRAVVRGNVAAIDRVLKIQERRSRLLGLDSPSKLELAGFLKTDDWRETEQVLLAALADYPQAKQAVIAALMELNNE